MAITWPKIPPSGIEKPRMPTSRIEQSTVTMRAYYENMIEWQKHEMMRNQKEMIALRNLATGYHDEAESLRNRDGVRRTAYEILLDIANDPTKPDMTRIKAAAEAAQYDRPKLTASINRNEQVTNIGDELDRARDRIGLISGT